MGATRPLRPCWLSLKMQEKDGWNVRLVFQQRTWLQFKLQKSWIWIQRWVCRTKCLIYFCNCSRENLHSMKPNEFSISHDAEGTKFVTRCDQLKKKSIVKMIMVYLTALCRRFHDMIGVQLLLWKNTFPNWIRLVRYFGRNPKRLHQRLDLGTAMLPS